MGVPAQTTGFTMDACIITRALFFMLVQDYPGIFEFAVVATGNRRQDHREWWQVQGNRVTTGVRNSELYVVPRNESGILHHVDNTINHNFAHESRDFYLRLTQESREALCRMVNANPLAPGGNNGIANLSSTVFNREVTLTVGARVDGGNVSGHIVNVSLAKEIVFACPL
jgi:hypothetical protein